MYFGEVQIPAVVKTYYSTKYAFMGISAGQARAPGLVGLGLIGQNVNVFE